MYSFLLVAEIRVYNFFVESLLHINMLDLGDSTKPFDFIDSVSFVVLSQKDCF